MLEIFNIANFRELRRKREIHSEEKSFVLDFAYICQFQNKLTKHL